MSPHPALPSRVLAALALAAAVLAACGGPEQMSGFDKRDATAVSKLAPLDDACAARTGRLVIEVGSTIVREFPNTELARLKHAKQPILLLWMRGERQAGRPPEADLSSLVAPEDYLAGDRVRFFEGRRLLERPLRALVGRRLELRLAENDRTAPPKWVAYAHAFSGAGAGAAGVVGVGLPAAGIDAFVDVLRQLDRDDLIILWTADVDALVGLMKARGALAVHLASTRVVAAGLGAGLPSAELDLLVYVEPEPGCP